MVHNHMQKKFQVLEVADTLSQINVGTEKQPPKGVGFSLDPVKLNVYEKKTPA